jgi:hypothetical protein
VTDTKLLLSNLLRPFQRLVITPHRTEASEEAFIISARASHELLVEHLEDRRLLHVFDQLNCLVVSLELDVAPVDAFLGVFSLLLCKHVLVKLLL